MNFRLFDWLIRVQTFAYLCIIIRNFGGIAESHAWHACVELKKFEDFIVNSKIGLNLSSRL